MLLASTQTNDPRPGRGRGRSAWETDADPAYLIKVIRLASTKSPAVIRQK